MYGVFKKCFIGYKIKQIFLKTVLKQQNHELIIKFLGY